MADLTPYGQISTFFTERLGAGRLSEETDLFDAALLDSLSFVDLVVFLEQSFGIRISPEELELENFRTIGRISSLVISRTSPKNLAAA